MSLEFLGSGHQYDTSHFCSRVFSLPSVGQEYRRMNNCEGIVDKLMDDG
jgi:hypothetical protein